MTLIKNKIPEFDTVDSSHFDKICQPCADNAKLDKFGGNHVRATSNLKIDL